MDLLSQSPTVGYIHCCQFSCLLSGALGWVAMPRVPRRKGSPRRMDGFQDKDLAPVSLSDCISSHCPLRSHQSDHAGLLAGLPTFNTHSCLRTFACDVPSAWNSSLHNALFMMQCFVPPLEGLPWAPFLKQLPFAPAPLHHSITHYVVFLHNICFSREIYMHLFIAGASLQKHKLCMLEPWWLFP